MALTAQSICKRATRILNDATSVRWTIDEIVEWLNDGQREVVLYRPDANPKTATATLAADTRQDLTTLTGISTLKPAKLIKVTRNVAATSSKRAVTLIDQEILDITSPDWHNGTASVNIQHYTFDPRDPRAFYVYPKATALAQLETIFGAYPDDITVPAPGGDYTTVSGNIGVSEIFGNALLDYVLYRAFSKDTKFTSNAARAQFYYQAYAQAIGIETQATLVVDPNANDNKSSTA
jgi:hypothetical protein